MRRLKAAGIAVAAAIVGVGLIVLHQVIATSARDIAEQETAATQPATAAAEPTPTSAPPPPAEPSPPASPAPTDPARPPDTPSQREMAAQNMGSLVFMFGLLCFGVAVIALGWIVMDIYKSQPAWKKTARQHQRR